MTKKLDLRLELHRMLIEYRLRCLEIAVQMVGPKPYKEGEYLEQYFKVSNLISEHIRIAPDIEINWEDIKAKLDAADPSARSGKAPRPNKKGPRR